MSGIGLNLPLWHPAMLLGTWFGVGMLPIMPGSWASLIALPFAWAICSLWGAVGLILAAGAAFFAGWWAAGKVVAASGVADPRAIVIDEIAAQWLALVPAPLDPLAYAAAFIFFRIFDIWKPWPVRWVERRIGGGLGIMLDDVFAALYAVLVLSAALAICGLFGVRL